jgi:hypothetical protein
MTERHVRCIQAKDTDSVTCDLFEGGLSASQTQNPVIKNLNVSARVLPKITSSTNALSILPRNQYFFS